MKNNKIIIIDEDKEFLGSIERVLTLSGYAPVVVDDMSVDINIILQMKPKVILLGLQMSRKIGFELASKIDRGFKIERIPMIVMSEVLKDEFRFLLNLCGVDRFLTKPFQPLDVIWTIENLAGEDKQPDEVYGISIEERFRKNILHQSQKKIDEGMVEYDHAE